MRAGRSDNGFHSPQCGGGGGDCLAQASPSTSPSCTRSGRGRRSTGGSESERGPRAAAGPRKSEPHGPKEKGLQEGGARCGEETERRPAGSGCRRPGTPPGNPPQGQGEGGGVPRARRRQNLPAVLLREEVGAVVQAFLRGRWGPARRGRGWSEGRHKGRTLVPSRRGPAPLPRARRPHRAPRPAPRNTHHHGCSEARASAGAYRTAGRREPAAAAAGCRRAGPRSSSACPAPPCPPRLSLPDAGGRGLRARKKGSVPSAQLRWRSSS